MATPEMVVRTADDETEKLSPEQIEEAVRVAWDGLQQVPSYVERPQPEEMERD